jgi:hypothetical protein
VVTRQFRDGHRERWWVTELMLFGYGPNKPVRAICATTDRRTLPEKATWYLTTNLTGEQASLAEVVRLYGLRIWVEESYKRMKDELGWADFMVRSDRAIRRHWAMVCCAFAFCWWHEAYRARVVDASTEMLSAPHLRKHQSGGKKSNSSPQSRLIHAGPRRYAQCELGWPRYNGSHVTGKPSSAGPHQTRSCSSLAPLKVDVAYTSISQPNKVALWIWHKSTW